MLLLLLLSHFSRVWLCATPSLGFSRQEHWSGLPFPSPMHKSEKWKWSHSVMSDSSRPHGLQPTRLLHPWDFPGKSTGVGCHCLPSTKSVQSVTPVRLFVNLWTASYQASPSNSNTQLVSIESVMTSNHLIFYHPSPSLPAFNLC